MRILITRERTWEVEARTLFATIDGTGPGMLGTGTIELGDALGVTERLTAAAAGVPLGNIAKVPVEDGRSVILLSVLAHDRPSTRALLRSALSRALLDSAGVVAAPLLTCGRRFRPDSVLTDMVSESESGTGEALIISVPPWHWESAVGYAQALGLEVL